jgi:2-polyprenyl-3-methyl-5-hydroxy-6-metoxy-1,4-benzoquinol methylase
MVTANLTAEALEQLRQHFNRAPYPNVPLESIPHDADQLYIHSLTTAIYRRDQRVVSPVGKVILDAGCGTGYKSHMLAIANPGAKIVGIDLSEDSVVMARQRFDYHQLKDAEFHAMPLERIDELGLQFDYINCDEVLYLVPDGIQALQAMRSVLRPEGIIRVNYHSESGRRLYRAAQAFFHHLGCLQGPPDAADLALVRQTMEALKNHVTLKEETWRPQCLENDEIILANYLLQNDKSWSVKQLFAALEDAGLNFHSMVQWWRWNLMDLFDIDELPFEAVMQLSELSQEDQFDIYESIHGKHRLLDIWCGHQHPPTIARSIEDWSEAIWRTAMVHLHPQLLSASFKADLFDCAASGKMLNNSGYLKTTTVNPETIFIDSLTAGCLLPLLDGGCYFQDLVDRRIQLYPTNPVTMTPVTAEAAYLPLQQILTQLESVGYVMLVATA